MRHGIERSAVAMLGMFVALTLVVWPTAASVAAKPSKPCRVKHPTACVYDAKHRGNHQGRSFWVSKNGTRHYVGHHVAHRMLHAKPKPKPNLPLPEGFAASGDSITLGVGSSDPATRSWPFHNGIPYVGRSGGCLVLSICSGPPLLDTFVADLPALRQPHTVIVEIGTNDLRLVDSPAMIQAYTDLLALGSSAGVRVVLTTIPPRDRGTDFFGQPIRPKIRTINAWIRTQDHIDLDPCIGDGTATPSMLARYDSDGLHPNDAGYGKVAHCVYDAMTG